MVAPATGKVVLIPYPFSDLSQSKLRPAIVLAGAGRGDWILCQVTSNPYGDPLAVPLADDSFAEGSLRVRSFARPGKLFTASAGLMLTDVGTLKERVVARVVGAVIDILRGHRNETTA